MTEFEDQDLIAALRSAGHCEPAFAVTPLSETIRRGRAARRRRTVIAAAGGTTVMAGLVAGAVALPPMLSPDDTTLMPAGPSAGPSPSNPATPQPNLWEPRAEQRALNRNVVIEMLPDGFVEITDENRDDAMGMAGLAMAEDAPATDGLLKGMSGGVSLITIPADEFAGYGSGWCDRREEKGSTMTACDDYPVGQAIVKTQEGSRSAGGRGGAWESIRTTYGQPDGDAVVLDLYAWEDDNRTTPERQAAARAWLQDTHEQIVRVVVDPAVQPPAQDPTRRGTRR